ncbi:LacI family DNA-binding transcriptional regulator [Lacihabitans soyangensis]|uniref:LacI family transcriptional regulator n=1 Tax=Lacihabitans soyangensis TaxID=869394 RepID=A0AAE3H3T7_9BACT|nr:LacI family DNA-binding transcriptional regulator [Lacihabitans soyangensis]MCP9764432.1 LacI family transcriptional regulator [Lacihabitans soyangensis]
MKSGINIKIIAEALSISISTVSRALQNNPKIGLKTRELVIQKAKELQYVPNPASMFLKGKKMFVIGILVPALEEEYFCKVIDAVEDFFERLGYQVFVFQTRDDMNRQDKALELMLKYRVDGLLVSLAANTNNYVNFKKVEDFGIPVVFFDRVPRSYQAHRIKCDIQKGAVDVISYLKSLNCRKIALINGPSNLDASDERLNGYLLGLQENGIRSSPKFIKSCDLKKVSVMSAMETLLDQDEVPDAVFSFNDYVALYAMLVCKKRGIRPNDEIKFVSFGNLQITSLMNNPPLASVEQFPNKTGIEAARLLLDIIDEKIGIDDYREKVIETKLVVH